jgi:hypothetical protein
MAFVSATGTKGIESLALQRADLARRGARPARPHGVRPHAAARRRDGVDEALPAPRERPGPGGRCSRGAADEAEAGAPGQRRRVHAAAGLARHAQRVAAGTSRRRPSWVSTGASWTTPAAASARGTQLDQRRVPRRGVPRAPARRAARATAQPAGGAQGTGVLDAAELHGRRAGGAGRPARLGRRAPARRRLRGLRGLQLRAAAPGLGRRPARTMPATAPGGRQGHPEHRPRRRGALRGRWPAADRAPERGAGRSELQRPQRRGADHVASHGAPVARRWCWAFAPAHGRRSAGKARFTVLALDTPASRWGQALEVRGRLAQAVARASAWSAASTPTTTAPSTRTWACCAAASPTSGACCCAATLDTAGEVELVASARTPPARWRRRRPASGSPARASCGSSRTTTTASTCCPRRSVRTRRDRAAAGAHALPRGHRPGGGRARRRDVTRWSRCAATTRRSS